MYVTIVRKRVVVPPSHLHLHLALQRLYKAQRDKGLEAVAVRLSFCGIKVRKVHRRVRPQRVHHPAMGARDG